MSKAQAFINMLVQYASFFNNLSIFQWKFTKTQAAQLASQQTQCPGRAFTAGPCYSEPQTWSITWTAFLSACSLTISPGKWTQMSNYICRSNCRVNMVTAAVLNPKFLTAQHSEGTVYLQELKETHSHPLGKQSPFLYKQKKKMIPQAIPNELGLVSLCIWFKKRFSPV